MHCLKQRNPVVNTLCVLGYLFVCFLNQQVSICVVSALVMLLLGNVVSEHSSQNSQRFLPCGWGCAW